MNHDLCRACADRAFAEWRGWPKRDSVPVVPHLLEGAGPECNSTKALAPQHVVYFNFHSEHSAGLPDYYTLEIHDPESRQHGFLRKWGRSCVLRPRSATSARIPPPRTRRDRHPCQYTHEGIPMRTLTCAGSSDDELEEYRPATDTESWELATSGEWSQSPYHSGWIAYYVLSVSPGTRVMKGVERNAELDGVTEEDIAEGLLNDDQIQAMWGMSLEEAQNQVYEQIVAVLLDAPEALSSKDVATHLCSAIEADGGKVVEVPDGDGLLE